jgi:rare lipoprotein A (peptidoglycan hydrolase)
MDRRKFQPAFLLIICGLLCGWASVANGGQAGKTERGAARWISKSFQGRPTASGEPHDYNNLVGAHRTFPFGTYVHVRNRTNGKTAVLRINDRISHRSDSLLLVSWRAAKMLEMLESGVAKVEIRRFNTQIGIASWYGKPFHGRKTANGEIYDMNQMTAAHKLLPFNIQVYVTNLDNKKSTIVRINDRGPFVKDRIIDLSRKAAIELGMLLKGTAPVRLEILPPLPDKPAD